MRVTTPSDAVINHFPSVAIDDMMSEDEVLKKINMKKSIKNAVQQHPYKIYHSEQCGWWTDVDDPTKANGKKRIRKITEEKLWLALAEWYGNLDKKNVSLSEIYPDWLEHKKTPKNAKNIQRIEASWKAYYADEPLSQELIQMPIPDITVNILRKWAEALIKKHYPVDKKKFSRMFSIVGQCLEYAADEDDPIVTENVWERAKKKVNKELVTEKEDPLDEEQVFTDEERRLIREGVYEHLEKYKKQASSAGLQILFLFETGLRIGECCGLKWTDIKGGYLHIQRQADNNGVWEWTKSSHSRRAIPLTRRAKEILQDVENFNREHGYTAEWIFQNGSTNYDGRLSYNAADRKLRKICKRLDTAIKSPHKLRKTCLSTLLDSPNINDRTVQRFAGHSDIATTRRYYSFERRSKEEQAKAIDEALSLDWSDC